MKFNARWWLCAGMCALSLPCRLLAQTVITNTRAEVSFMATLWEVDPIQISALASAQYPSVGGGTSTWQFIFPSFSTASDGDIHVNMAIDSSGTGSTSGNKGESPIVPEVINATTANLTIIDGLNGAQALVRGIFRWYSEHTGERKYEIHPATELLNWNGSAFVLTNDYRPNIRFDNGNTSQTTQHMITTFNGSDVMTAAVMVADSDKIVFTYPSPRFNYCIYDGVTLSRLTNDATSQFFWFKPSLVPTAVVRCRIVTNTVGAIAAAGLVSNQTVTVNALTRCDMLVMSNQIAGLTAGQTSVFTWPVELITLNISNAPPVVKAVTPACGGTGGGTPVTITGSNFVSAVGPLTVTFGGATATEVVVVNSTQLTATTPPGTAGAKDVVVKDAYNQSGTLTNGFTYGVSLSFGGLTNASPAIEAATLTWAAASGDGVIYSVYEGTASGAENFASPILTTTNLSAFVAPLDPGSNAPITYFFVVRASDACGNSESNSVEKSVQPLLGFPPGDVNADSRVNASDSLLINQVLVSLRSSNDAIFATAGFANGDVNANDVVNSADSLLINQVLVGLRSYLVTKIVPSSRINTVPTRVTIFGIGFPTNSVSEVTIGPPVNLVLSNVVVISREQITAVVPAGGGNGTGTVNVAATPTNGVISFGRFINR